MASLPATSASLPLTTVIPEDLAEAVAGCWQIKSYRIELVRVGQGLSAKQRGTGPLGRDVERESEVRFSPRTGLLGFGGVGRIHRVVVTLRKTESGVQAAFGSKVTPGRWTEGVFQDLERCAP